MEVHPAAKNRIVKQTEPILSTRSIRMKKLAEKVKAIFRVKEGRVGLVICLFMIISAVFAPWIAPYDPLEQNIPNRLAGPSLSNLLGTDYLGRDILSRIIYGSRVSLKVAFGTNILSVIVGVLLGVVAGQRGGGKLDYFIILVFDVVRSFPQIILALAIVAVLGASLTNLILALSFTLFPFYGRIARSQTLALKELDFIKAAEALGLSRWRIMFRHITPNILAPVFVCWGMQMTNMILFESGLSFLGLGVRPPEASWGGMLKSGYKYIQSSPWMVISPSLTLIIALIGFTLLSEGLKVAFDPKGRREYV